jgi:flagellar biosynthesis protein FlhB
VAERRPPSRARLLRALGAGDTPLSPFAVRAASLVVAVVLAPGLVRATSDRFTGALRAAVAAPERVAPAALATDTAILVAPLLIAASVAAVVAGVAQTGGVFAWRAPRLGRLLDELRAYDVARALVVAGVVAFIGWHAFAGELPLLAASLGNVGALLEGAARLASRVAWPAVAFLAFLAAIDIALRRTLWLRRLSPTLEEARRERRETEGAPEVREARRRAHERLSRKD